MLSSSKHGVGFFSNLLDLGLIALLRNFHHPLRNFARYPLDCRALTHSLVAVVLLARILLGIHR